MRLTAEELEVVHEALACFHYEAEQALEQDYNNPAVCRWAENTMEIIDNLSDKIVTIMETIKNLEQKDVAAEVKLSPEFTDLEEV